VLAGLAERADIVLVDSAPLLPVSDTIALSSKVDALLLVVHAEAKRNVVVELQRALAACQAPCFGFVLTGAERETEGYYGAGYGYGGGGGTAATGSDRQPETAAATNGRPVSVGQESRATAPPHPPRPQTPGVDPTN
jgi:Mrp family chromosome partitioning ATPase